MGFIMRYIGLVVLFGFIFGMFVGCKTKTVYVPVKQITRETVTMRDTIFDTKLEYYRDTVVTPDTVSFLSNPYGFTWAETKGGKLHHSLSSWPDSSISVRTHYIERILTDSIPAPYAVEVPVYREKELSIWQKIRIRLGELCLVFLIVGLVYWYFRKH